MAASGQGADPAAAALAEIRRRRAQEYRQAPAESRPKIQLCGDCGDDIYNSKVCMKTGFSHAHSQTHLVAGLLVDASKKHLNGSELMEAIDAVRVRWQPSRTQLVKADATSLNIFQSFVYSMDWKLQRYGILYGTYDANTQTVSVHCIYEPEQRGNEHGFVLLEDRREARVDALASMLGLSRVGSICTHSPRDEAAITLTGAELLLCARDQSRFGDHCVLITMGPNLETGHINAQCWQASQQCIRFYQMGMLSAHSSCSVTEGAAATPSATSSLDTTIESKVPLELAQDDVDAKGHKRCVIKASSTTVDARWMTSYVAVEAFNSTIVSSTFIRISRPASAPPTFENLKIYLQDARRNRLPFHEKIADFHVLIFLMESVFDVRSDMPTIVSSIINKDRDRLRIYEEILKDRMR